MRALGLPLVGFYVLLTGVGALALWSSEASVFPAFNDGLGWATGLGLGLATGLAVVGLSRACTQRFTWAKLLADEFRNLFGEMRHREIALTALLSGVGEELLFRGVLQPALGYAISAAVFGVLHVGPNRRYIPWTLMAFAAGGVFGGLFLWTGSIVAPIVAHVLVNYLNLRHLAMPAAESSLPTLKPLTAR